MICRVLSAILLVAPLLSPCWSFTTSSPLLQTSSRPSLSSLFMADDDAQAKPSRSIWAPSEWKFTLNLGREPGTLMTEEWGATGSRCIFDLPVSVTSDSPFRSDKEDPMLQRNGCRLTPMSDGTYKIGEDAEQKCSFAPGGEWKIQLPRGGNPNGKAGKLMGYVDLTTPIRKNDIVLEKGERIYLTAKCWREGQLETALRRLRPYQQEYREREEKLQLASEDQFYGFERLVIDRDNALKEYQDANIYYPTINDDDPNFNWQPQQLEWSEGPWPGETEWLTVEPLFLMVRRTKFFINEEYHVIGTWAAEPISTE